MPFMQTGHPDWIATSSTPIPVLIYSATGIPIGDTTGIIVDVTSGGAYILSFDSSGGTGISVADIVIDHLDILGGTVHSDFFGGVYSGVDSTFPTSLGVPTVCRGNIYGSQLRVNFHVATSAWGRTVTGIGTLNLNAADVDIYTIPNTLADPEPVVSNGRPLNTAGISIIPGNLLYSLVDSPIGPGVSKPITPMVPYAGPVVHSLFQFGDVATPANVRSTINGYSVRWGTSPEWSAPFATTTTFHAEVWGINIPSLFNTIQIVNVDGAQTATVWASVVASLSG